MGFHGDIFEQRISHDLVSFRRDETLLWHCVMQRGSGSVVAAGFPGKADAKMMPFSAKLQMMETRETLVLCEETMKLQG